MEGALLPVLLRIGPFELPSYGVLLAAAWLAAIQYALSRRADAGLSEDEAWTVVYWIFGGALVGGKLLYLAANRADVDWSRPVETLRYGFVFYGGLLGALAAGWALCRRRGWDLLRVAGPFAAALPLGQAVGRVGCLLAGCCYGRPSALLGGGRHPAPLYEALLCLALFAWLRTQKRDLLLRYLVGYAMIRFSVEFFRGDDRGGFLLGLSPSQWLALATAATAAHFARRRRA